MVACGRRSPVGGRWSLRSLVAAVAGRCGRRSPVAGRRFPVRALGLPLDNGPCSEPDGAMSDYRDLEVWRLAHALRLAIYRHERLPKA